MALAKKNQIFSKIKLYEKKSTLYLPWFSLQFLAVKMQMQV